MVIVKTKGDFIKALVTSNVSSYQSVLLLYECMNERVCVPLGTGLPFSGAF